MRPLPVLLIAIVGVACGAARPNGFDAIAVFKALKDTPKDCALGLSGPTVNPGDAVVYARADALQNLALGDATVKLDSIQTIEEGAELRYRSVLKQHAHGRLEGARIVRVWADREGRGRAGTRDVVYALACRPEAAARFAPWPGYEALVAVDAGRACAWGFAGPTLLSNQNERALDDAKRRLAEVLAADVESILVDFDLTDVQGWSHVAAPADVQARVNADAVAEGDKLDTDGTGPLGLKGVAYVLACLP